MAADDPGQGAPGHCARCPGAAAIPDLTPWRLGMLERAAEIGLEMMRVTARRAQAAEAAEQAGIEPAGPPVDHALGYQRINRAFRKTLALHEKFEAQARTRERETAAEAAARLAAEAQRQATAQANRRERDKTKVRRAAIRAIYADGDERDDKADLFSDLRERLEEYDDYDDFGRCSIGETAWKLCRAMGLDSDPALWADEPWAIAEMRDKPPGSPFADWLPELANDDRAQEREPAPTARGRGPP